MDRNPCSAGNRKGRSTAGRLAHGALAGALLLAAGLAGCKQDERTAELPQPVRVMVVRPEAQSSTFSYAGIVRARYESDLGFRVGGKIVERLVNIGDPVASGQVLARLDVTDLRLTIEANEAEISAARSNLQQAAAAERRAKDLLERGHMAMAVYDQRKAAADEAQGRLDRAERNLALARHQADYATLRADHAGVVTQLPIEIGQVVAAGQLVVRLARDGEREAVVAIPESRLAAIRQAQTEVELWAADKRRYAAKLREVAPQADAATRTYQARFSILEADPAVALGMTATVFANSSISGAVVRIPSSAVINDGRGPSVWVVDGSGRSVQRRPVDVASFGQHEVVISKGLSEGDRLVTLGVHVLDEAKRIRIVEERPPVKLAAEHSPAAQ